MPQAKLVARWCQYHEYSISIRGGNASLLS